MEDLTLLSGRQWIASQEDSSILEGCSKISAIKMVNVIVAELRCNINCQMENFIAVVVSA